MIHVGTQGLKRAGQRLAKIALRELFGQVGATTPTLDRVTRGPNNTLVVKFKGVNSASTWAAPARRDGRRHGPAMGGHGRAGMWAGGTALGLALDGGRVRRARPEAGAAHRRVLDPQGRRLGDPPDLRGRRRQGSTTPSILKLTGAVPEGAILWYGYGLDPYCNLIDGLDMAVPVFGPIALDEVK